MRKLLATVLLAGVLALVPGPAAGSGEPGDVHGRVLDITCFGPCAPDLNPRPFEGPAKVVVKTLPDHQPVAEIAVKHSRFRVEVAPGLYRVRVIPYPSQPKDQCWRGSAKRAPVNPGEFTRVRLTAENICID